MRMIKAAATESIASPGSFTPGGVQCRSSSCRISLERRADMYVSTLRDVITALGGELEITARFPEGEVRIKQFDLDSAA